MMSISGFGRLTKDPKKIQTRTGNMMSVCCLAIKIPADTMGANDQITEFCDLTAFGKQAELLLKHQKGDFISVIGNVKYSEFNGKRQLVIFIDAITSNMTIQPDINNAVRGSQSDFKPIKPKVKQVVEKPKRMNRPSADAVRAAKKLLETDAMAKQSIDAGFTLPFDEDYLK